MKVLVTGGAGFIGSHIVDRLVNVGEVTIYDNLSSGRWEFIRHHMGRPGFCFVEADLLDAETLRQVVKGHDVVFHMAANPDIRNGIEKTFLDLEQGTISLWSFSCTGMARVSLIWNHFTSGLMCGDKFKEALTSESSPFSPREIQELPHVA